MKHLGRILAGAVALAGVGTISNSASAALINFSANASGLSVVSSPGDDLSTATSISETSWTIVGATGPLIVSSPITISVGSTIMITFDGGLDTDTLTIGAGDINFFNNTLDIVADGHLTGPGAPSDNSSQIVLSFTQSGGKNHTISGSATYTDVGVVPEPATWAMMLLGFAGLGYAGFRRSGKGRALAI
jgi:hypothetical protein